MNVKFSKEEITILLELAYERKIEMNRDLSTKDEKIYLTICGLNGKLNGILDLIDNNEKTKLCCEG